MKNPKKYVWKGKDSASQLDAISIHTVLALVVYFFRQREDKLLHALSVELWVGQQKPGSREPVHALGWRQANVREYIKSASASFFQQYGVSISGGAATVELSPNLFMPPRSLSLKGWRWKLMLLSYKQLELWHYLEEAVAQARTQGFAQWIQKHQGEKISLRQLQQALGMPIVEV